MTHTNTQLQIITMRNTTNTNSSRNSRDNGNKKPFDPGPATTWRNPDPDFAAYPHLSPKKGTSVAPSGGQTPDPREVFAVVNHEGLQGLYCWREDATAHAKVCAGKVQTMRINYELPPWVKVMVDRANDLAAMQSGKHPNTVH